MATLLDAYNLRYASNNLKNRVITAIAKKAIDVLNEDLATSNHANRLVWAKSALVNTGEMAEKIMWNVIADPNILSVGDLATDAQVISAVAAAINTFAQ